MRSSRRDFLKSALGGTVLATTSAGVPPFLARAARAAEASARPDETVLVVVQLTGGNDGLNTVVPHADDQYGRNRLTLRLSDDDVHRIDDYCGFHPEMRDLARLFDDGTLSVVQGVGYPKSHRGHDEAMRHWHTAHPENPYCETGWVGRAVDSACRPGEHDLPGLFVGTIPQPFALTARRAVVPSARTAGDLVIRPAAPRRIGAAETHPAQDDTPADRNGEPLLDFVRRGTKAAYATSRQVEAVLADARASGDYPAHRFAADLKTVAQLIRADLGIRIFFTELGGGGIGGFDNHANQRDNHAALLRQLSESVAALARDLARDRLLDRVTLMTFSEFGRTLAENGRRGTDHGAAQPVMLVGGRLKGGLIGPPPDLGDLDQDSPRAHTDFRGLYATMLDRWLGLDSAAVLGAKYETVDVLAG